MMSALISRVKLKRQRTNFRADQSGVAAIEFAIIAPMLIGLYLGLAELATALSVDRKISHSASVAGDLAAQVRSLDKNDAADLISAVLHVANLKNTSDYAIRIESFERQSDGTINSEGAILYSSGGTASVPAYKTSSLTEDLLPKGGGLVTASVQYRYKPFGFGAIVTEGEQTKSRNFLPDFLEMNETFLLKPRQSTVLDIGQSGVADQIKCTGRRTSVSCS